MVEALLTEQYLNVIYQNAKTTPIKSIPETYGEILYPSLDKLIATLALTSQDVFVDLGSGLGKIVLYVFLRTLVKESHGIEIIPELHQQALAARERVYRELPDFFQGERKLLFSVGDFLNIPLDTATVILIGSPCFTPDMLFQLGEMINKTTSIHTVLTLRPIPTLERLSFKKTVRIQGTWDAALCYVYSLLR